MHNAAVIRSVLAGDSGSVRDVVLLNAAAGLVAWDLKENPDQLRVPIVDRLRDKLAIAAEAVDSGAAAAKLEAWVAATRA